MKYPGLFNTLGPRCSDSPLIAMTWAREGTWPLVNPQSLGCLPIQLLHTKPDKYSIHLFIRISFLHRFLSSYYISVTWKRLHWLTFGWAMIDYSFSWLLTHYNWFFWFYNFPNHSYSSWNKDRFLDSFNTFHLFAHTLQFAQYFLQNSTQKHRNFTQILPCSH